MTIKTISLISISAAAFALGTVHAQTTIYADDFDIAGGTANLDGAPPQTGSGTWTAADMFDRNGDVNITNAGAGSATLAFGAADGLIYTLDASISLSSGGSGDWVGMGFADSQSASTGTGFRFLSGNNVEGRAWMYFRENTNNPGAQLTGNDAGTGWTGFANSPNSADLRIILDTTAGAGNWTATWLAKASGSLSYTVVRSAATLLDEDIGSVGFAAAGSGVTANITNFSLTSAVPEPSTFALIGLAGLALLVRRRR